MLEAWDELHAYCKIRCLVTKLWWGASLYMMCLLYLSVSLMRCFGRARLCVRERMIVVDGCLGTRSYLLAYTWGSKETISSKMLWALKHKRIWHLGECILQIDARDAKSIFNFEFEIWEFLILQTHLEYECQGENSIGRGFDSKWMSNSCHWGINLQTPVQHKQITQLTPMLANLFLGSRNETSFD